MNSPLPRPPVRRPAPPPRVSRCFRPCFFRRFLLLPLLLGACLCAGRPAAGHPFHVSLAEVEFNAARQRFEVALQVDPFELEKELRLRAEDPVDLEHTPRIDQRLADYLQDVFQVSTEARQACELRWVGKELSLKEAWLYFEIAVPADAERVRLSNRLLFTSHEQQANTVHLRVGQRRWTVQCTPADSGHWVPLR